MVEIYLKFTFVYGNIKKIHNQGKRIPGILRDLSVRSTLTLLIGSVVLKQLKQVFIKSGHKVCFFLNWCLVVTGKSGKGKEIQDCKLELWYAVVATILGDTSIQQV